MLQTIPRINRETYVIASPLYRWVQLAKSVLEDGLNVREDNFRTRAMVIVCIERSSLPRPATFIWRFFRYMERLREGYTGQLDSKVDLLPLERSPRPGRVSLASNLRPNRRHTDRHTPCAEPVSYSRYTGCTWRRNFHTCPVEASVWRLAYCSRRDDGESAGQSISCALASTHRCFRLSRRSLINPSSLSYGSTNHRSIPLSTAGRDSSRPKTDLFLVSLESLC